jgi:hypothetical protein
VLGGCCCGCWCGGEAVRTGRVVEEEEERSEFGDRCFRASNAGVVDSAEGREARTEGSATANSSNNSVWPRLGSGVLLYRRRRVVVERWWASLRARGSVRGVWECAKSGPANRRPKRNFLAADAARGPRGWSTQTRARAGREANLQPALAASLYSTGTPV